MVFVNLDIIIYLFIYLFIHDIHEDTYTLHYILMMIYYVYVRTVKPSTPYLTDDGCEIVGISYHYVCTIL